MTKPIKITRQAIKQAIKETPIENILVGAHNADKVNLTKKQKDFARKVAEGKPKAKAYRETYNTQASPQSQAEQASRLSTNPKISAMIESFRVANEAREYLIPAQIRTMAIQNLVGIAIDQEEKTANKLKALELIGKMSEVALFTERKELIHTNNSADIKAQLMEGLRLAFSNSRSMNDLAKRKAESLLIELEDARPMDIEEEPATHSAIQETATPLPTDPQKSTKSKIECMHSIPDIQTSSQDLTITAVIVTNPLESGTCASIGVYPDEKRSDEEGEGVIVSDINDLMSDMETPPVNISNKKG